MQRNSDAVMKVGQLLETQTLAGTGSEVDYTGVDMSNCRNGTLIIAAGAFDSGSTVTIMVQTSNDNGVDDAWADVLSSAVTVLTAADQAFLEEELLYMRRYVRAQVTATNGKNVILGLGVIGWAAPVNPPA